MSTAVQGASGNGKQTGRAGALKVVLASVVLLAMGMVGGMEFGERFARNPSDRNQPHLVRRDGGTGEALPAGLVETPMSDSTAYRSTYYQIAEPFTLNLGGSGTIVVASLGISTLCDQVVLDNVKENETALKSAIVETLSTENGTDLRTDQGRDRVRRRLVNAINRALVEKTGYGGIDNVYVTDLVTQ